MILINSPILDNLISLDIADNNLRRGGIDLLANSPRITNLIRLDVRNNQVGTKGIQALAESPYLINLKLKIIIYLLKMQFGNFIIIFDIK